MTKLLHFTLANACIFTLLITLAHHVRVANADYEHECPFDITHTHLAQASGVCGSKLADMVMNLCQAFGSFYSTKKRDTRNDERLRGILLNKKDAFSYLAKRQVTSSIVCECCINTCTVSEFLQYCDLPPSSYRGNGGRPRNSITS